MQAARGSTTCTPNRMREELPYAEVPIRLRFSARKRRENPGDAQPARRDDSAEQ